MDNDYHEKICNSRLDVLKVRLDAMDKALDLSRKELERRLEGLNELREDVTKDREWFIRKEAYDIKMDFFDEFVHRTNDRLTTLETKVVVWGSLITFVVFVIQLVFHFFVK